MPSAFGADPYSQGPGAPGAGGYGGGGGGGYGAGGIPPGTNIQPGMTQEQAAQQSNAAPLPLLSEMDLSIQCLPQFMSASVGKIVGNQAAAAASKVPTVHRYYAPI